MKKLHRRTTAFLSSFLTLIALYFIIFLPSCYRKENFITHSEFLMDTLVEIKILDDKTLSATEIQNALNDAFGEMKRIYNKYNAHNDKSFISELNDSSVYKLDDETKALLLYAIRISSLTDGNFDPAILTLEKNLWEPVLKGKRNAPPSDKEIKNLLASSSSVGINKLRLDGNILRKPTMVKLDLGAFVKGYAVDRAVETLKKHNIKSALVNAGGDLYGYGKKRWRIAVKHPRSLERNKNFLGIITVSNQAVATSGDYERFVIIDGKRYHHIINPSSGMPADKAISATIIAASCVEADALSTAVFVAGGEEGIKILEKNFNSKGNHAEGLIVTRDGRFFRTEGFKKMGYRMEF